MLVFLDVLGPWGLKIVKIDPSSGTPPGIKILKNRPKNRKNRNRSDFRFLCLTKSLGNWILTEIDTLKSIFDRPVPELDRFLFIAMFSAILEVIFPAPPSVDSQPRRATQKSKKQKPV